MTDSKFTHEVMQPLRVESGLSQLDLEIYLLKSEVERLTSGPGGIMEMKQTIANKEAKIERLKEVLRGVIAVADRKTVEFDRARTELED